jgi:hypothetical protein
MDLEFQTSLGNTVRPSLKKKKRLDISVDDSMSCYFCLLSQYISFFLPSSLPPFHLFIYYL